MQKLEQEGYLAEGRQIVFVGDYVDRGPESKESVDFLLEFKRDHDCVFLRGNHEQMLLDAYLKGNYSLWMMNGGGATLESYGARPNAFDLPADHLEFYKNTLMYYDTPEYFFVHAGIPPTMTIEQCLEGTNGESEDDEIVQEFLWERSHLGVPETPWEKTVVFGHTPRAEPVIRSNMLGIDTGCVYASMGYGILTAALLPEEKFIQQECLD